MGYTTRMRKRWRTPAAITISRNAKKLIDMHQLDENEITGTGPGGNITVKDVKKRLDAVASTLESITSKTSEEEE